MKQGRLHTFAKATCIAALAVCALFALGGCVHSDRITEKVIDNDPSSQVDESLPPVLINTVNADVKTDVLPRLDDAEDADEQEEEENMPEFDGDTSNPLNMTAPQTNYNKTASSSGKAQDKSNKTNKKKKKSSGKSKTKKGKSGNTGKGKKKSSTSSEGSTGKTNRKSSGSGDRYTNEEGEDPVIPDNIDQVAAVGNNAVIVSLVAGNESSTALVACDKDTKQNASKVLKKRSISKAKALWSNDGSSSGDMSSANLKKLYQDAVPDLVFVTEGSETLSESQINTLSKKKIDVYELPELTSASGIRKAVQIVGETLAKGGVAGAEENYKAYLKFHDDLIEKYQDAVGGMAGGYDFDKDENTSDADSTVVTLLVDGWDKDARYDDPEGYLNTNKGIATATLGYTSNPTSYYMSAGGVLNNAASKLIRNEKAEGVGIVWQFTHELVWKFARWSGLDSADCDLYKISGGKFLNCLLWHKSYGVDEASFGLGTDNFPAVVATSKDIAERFENSAKNAKQPYYAYQDIHPSGSDITVGYFTNEAANKFVQSCVGAGQESGTVLTGGKMYGIYTNPKGLVQQSADDALCSWVGGSVESVLETSWAYWKFCNGSESDFNNDVKEFYSTFYGYDVSSSDLKAIKAGVDE